MQTPSHGARPFGTLSYSQQRIHALKAELLRYRTAYRRLRSYVSRINDLLEQRERALACSSRARLFQAIEEKVDHGQYPDKENRDFSYLNTLEPVAPVQVEKESLLLEGTPATAFSVSPVCARAPRDGRAIMGGTLGGDVLDSCNRAYSEYASCTTAAKPESVDENSAQTAGSARADDLVSPPRTGASPHTVHNPITVAASIENPGLQEEVHDCAQANAVAKAPDSTQAPSEPPSKSGKPPTERAPARTQRRRQQQQQERRRRRLPAICVEEVPNIWAVNPEHPPGDRRSQSNALISCLKRVSRMLAGALGPSRRICHPSYSKIFALCGVSFGAGFLSAVLTIQHVECSSGSARRSPRA